MAKNNNISGERKLAYQVGLVLTALGFIIFLLAIFSEQTSEDKKLFFGGGFVVVMIGSLLCTVGAKGIAGSGLVLDPEQKRKDLEPMNRMLGGQVNDVLEEVNLKSHLGLGQDQIVKIKCQSCKRLNDENDRFCGGCGKEI